MTERIAIVGLGLIGGSAALSLGRVAIGVDPDAGARELAEASGAFESVSDSLSAVANADLILLCVPVSVVGNLLVDLAPWVGPKAVVTDVASVKGPVAAQAGRLPFGERLVPGHPMAGREVGGFGAAVKGLFEGRPWITTPTDRTLGGALERVEGFTAALGARPVRLSPEEHDRQVAYLSHLPHVAASALAALGSEGVRLDLAGPSWDGSTRVAQSSPSMWAGISLANADALEKGLEELQKEITLFREKLRAGDFAALEAWFEVGRQTKEKERRDRF